MIQTFNGLNILQINLHNSYQAMVEMDSLAYKHNIDLVLAQETYNGSKWEPKRCRKIEGRKNGRTSIFVYNSSLPVDQVPEISDTLVTAARVHTYSKIILVSVYSPLGSTSQMSDANLMHVLRCVEKGTQLLLNPSSMIIIGGDFNCHNQIWSSNRTNSRGETLLHWADQLNLRVLNQGEAPTFDTIRAGKSFSSHVDVTLATEIVEKNVSFWKVTDDFTASDHRAILFRLGCKLYTNRTTTSIFHIPKINLPTFTEELDTTLLKHPSLLKSALSSSQVQSKLPG